jgi:hypothetical protein
MLNLSLIVLQLVFPLCDYKVWIDTERGEEAKNHLCCKVELNLMEEEFRTHRTVEHRHAVFFASQREMDREEYKEKREEERAQKHEKARRAKAAYERGGEKALVKGKWARLTQD